MLYLLRAEARRFRHYLYREHQRGHGLLMTLVWRLPAAVTRKLYGKAARTFNSIALRDYVNARCFRAFLRGHQTPRPPRLYVIVMPNVLHFLVPCLNLLPKWVDVVLVHNGNHAWERDYLKARFPHIPAFALWSAPRSSLSHGDVLTLLLENDPEPFAILDHDMYVFDQSIFDRLSLTDTDYALGIFAGRSARTGIEYPHTHFLVLNSPLLRKLMHRYRVDAKLYRKAPSRLQPIFDRLGLKKGIFLKDYHDFFDTLHVLFALAHFEGLRPRPIAVVEDDSVYHIGGTSIGDHRTRDLTEQYLQLMFLERADDPVLWRRYAHLRGEFATADEVRAMLQPTAEVSHTLEVLDGLVRRIEARNNHRC